MWETDLDYEILAEWVLEKLRSESVDFIQLVEVVVHWQAFVMSVVNFYIPGRQEFHKEWNNWEVLKEEEFANKMNYNSDHGSQEWKPVSLFGFNYEFYYNSYLTDLLFTAVHKAHREELECVLQVLEKVLVYLPELLSRRWQCHSLTRIMTKLLHPGNSWKLRREAIRCSFSLF